MAREASIVLTSATLQTAFAEAYRSLRANLGVDGGMQGARALLVASGGPPPNPAELLASPRMRSVIADLCDHADVVLLDSPPCSLYSDAQELTRVTDGILYVLRSGPPGPVNHVRSLKKLQQGQARLIGIVMNQVDVRAAGYGRPYRGGAPARG